DSIIKTAVRDLELNQNILVASAILITSQIGLRIHEIITLEAGSLTSINGYMMFDTSTTKLHAERIEVLKSANELVVLAVTKLEEYSKQLRIEGESPYLFIQWKRNKKSYHIGLVIQ